MNISYLAIYYLTRKNKTQIHGFRLNLYFLCNLRNLRSFFAVHQFRPNSLIGEDFQEQ